MPMGKRNVGEYVAERAFTRFRLAARTLRRFSIVLTRVVASSPATYDFAARSSSRIAASWRARSLCEPIAYDFGSKRAESLECNFK